MCQLDWLFFNNRPTVLVLTCRRHPTSVRQCGKLQYSRSHAIWFAQCHPSRAVAAQAALPRSTVAPAVTLYSSCCWRGYHKCRQTAYRAQCQQQQQKRCSWYIRILFHVVSKRLWPVVFDVIIEGCYIAEKSIRAWSICWYLILPDAVITWFLSVNQLHDKIFWKMTNRIYWWFQSSIFVCVTSPRVWV